MTKRNPTEPTDTQTHWWVIQEVGIAYDNRLPLVEVRESGVDTQSGIAHAFQRIEYDENRREKCLIEMVQAIGALHQRALVKIQLLPESLAEKDLRPLIKTEGLSCNYVIQRGNKKEPAVVTQISSIRGGLFIDAPRVVRGDLLQVNIRYGDKEWSSSFESTDYYLKLRRSGTVLEKARRWIGY